MVQPIQYQIPGVSPDPFAGVLQGLKIGSSLAEMDAMRAQRALQQQQLQQQIQQRQAAMEQQQRFQQAQQDLLTKVRNKTATFADYQQVASMGDKDQAASSLNFFKEMNAQQQSELLRDSLETMAALEADPAIGVKRMREKAVALRNSGQEAEAKRMEDAARLAELNPEGAVAVTGVMLSYLPGADKAVEAYTKIRNERRAAELQPGKVREQDAKAAIEEVNLKYAGVLKQNEILKGLNEAKKLGLDAQALTLDIAKKQQDLNLGPAIESDARKIINDAVTDASKSYSIASQYDTLANSISADMSSGLLANANERVKRFFGSQDQVTALRQEYRRLRNSQVIANLPAGAASDRDIQIALEAFPDETADPDLIVRFLRGTAKLQKYDATLNDAKAQWVAQNGSLARASKPIEVLGQVAQKGADFNGTVNKLLPQVNVLDVPGIAKKQDIQPPASSSPVSPTPEMRRMPLEDIFRRTMR